MFDTFRSVALATAVNVGVFVASAWWSGDLDDRVAADIALIALNTLPLLLIRWNPVVAVVIMTVAYPLWVLTGNDGHILQSLPGLTAIYAAGVWSRHIAVRALALVCPTFMLGSALSGWWEGVDILEIGYIAIVFVAVWSLGVVLAARRAHVLELEEKTAALERAERRLAERAVAEERARIARELHDVVAHAMSVITVQAGVGAHLIDSQPTQAAAALRTIESMGREAMEEMRRMLAVLKGREGEGGDPQPGLGDVPRLLEQMRAAGVEVVDYRHQVEGSVSPGLDLAAYRVVQEALTNVAKHAPEATVAVSIAGDTPGWRSESRAGGRSSLRSRRARD